MFFYRGPETLDRLTQLKGKRIGVNFAFPLTNKILTANGISPDNATLLALAGPAAAKALKDGDADVILSLAELNSPLTQSLLRDPDVRLMSLTQAEALRRVFPFLNRLVLPQGVIDLEKNIPSSDVSIIATTTAVIVRKDLHPELVYLLARTLAEEHGGAGFFIAPVNFPRRTIRNFPSPRRPASFTRTALPSCSDTCRSG